VISGLQPVIAHYGVWQDLRIDRGVLLATTALTFLVSLLFRNVPHFKPPEWMCGRLCWRADPVPWRVGVLIGCGGCWFWRRSPSA